MIPAETNSPQAVDNNKNVDIKFSVHGLITLIIYTAVMLLDINGKFTMGKLNRSLLS